MKKVVFTLSDMDCAACALTIDGDLEEREGVAKAVTSYAKGKVEVTFDPEKVSEEEIIGIIKKAGYAAKL